MTTVNEALRRLSRDNGIPRHLDYVHDRVTVPSEGGPTRPGFDNTGFTFRGITVDTFKDAMENLGVHFSSWNQAQAELRRIARTRSLHDEFADFVSYVHYRNYHLRPGFDQLPEPFQSAIYDPSFHRGTGSGLMMLARMLEREGLGDFPGIHSIASQGAVDTDPVVLERIIDEHLGHMRDNGMGSRGNYRLVPTLLVERFERYGLQPGTDFHLYIGDREIDLTSSEPIRVEDAKNVRIDVPYSERPLERERGHSDRAQWDQLVMDVSAAAQAYVAREQAAGRTPAEIASSIVTAVERERVEHYRQITLVEPSNGRYVGWYSRTERAAREISALYGGHADIVTQVAEIPEEQREALRHINSLRSAIDCFNRSLNLISSPAINQHIEVLGQVFADRGITVGDVRPSGRQWRRATHTSIDLEDILPGIDFGATDAADDNTVLATNAFGAAIPDGGPLQDALVAALREYYENPENMDALNEADLESLGRIRFDVYQNGRGGTYVDINEITPNVNDRRHRQVTGSTPE